MGRTIKSIRVDKQLFQELFKSVLEQHLTTPTSKLECRLDEHTGSFDLTVFEEDDLDIASMIEKYMETNPSHKDKVQLLNNIATNLGLYLPEQPDKL